MLVQTTLAIIGEPKVKRQVIIVTYKLIWLASVCTSVAFMASSYIVVGRKNEWAAVLITVVGAVIMVGVLVTLTYYVIRVRIEETELMTRKKVAKMGTNST